MSEWMLRLFGDGLVLLAALASAGSALAAVAGHLVVGRIAAGSRPRVWRRTSNGLAVVAAVALLSAVVTLGVALIARDWSIAYVADHTRSSSAFGYRLAALWSGAEGSLLVFVAMLALVVAYATRWNTRYQPRTIAVGSGLVAATTAVVFTIADPFVTLAVPAVRGAGLTPILEHRAMLYHPPILYCGLALTFVPYLAVLAGRRAERAVVGSWVLLTVGLATGANWAYVELGWGGWWAWDPVENTVLMPWLVLTAALHLRRATTWSQRHAVLADGVEQAPFVLVLFGSAVTRSGGLSSVHAFADSAGLGWSLGAVCGVALLVMVLASKSFRASMFSSARTWPGGGTFLLVAAGLGLAMTVVVMVGTAVPLVVSSIARVGPNYFQRLGAVVLVAAMVVMVVMAATVVVASVRRGRSGLPAIGVRVVVAAGSVAAGAPLGLWAARSLGLPGHLSALVALAGLVVFAQVGVAVVGVRPLAMMLAHIAVAVVSVGVAGTAASQVGQSVLEVGESMSVGGWHLVYVDYQVRDGPYPGSEAALATVTVSEEGAEPVVLQPGLVSYPDRGIVLAETGLHSTPIRDLQVVLSTVTDTGLGSFTLAVRPAVWWVWWGTGLLAVAGLLAMWPRRHRGGPAFPSGGPPPQPAGDRSPLVPPRPTRTAAAHLPQT